MPTPPPLSRLLGAVSLVAFVFAPSCDDRVEVVYEVTCDEVICPNANYYESSARSVRCVWHCADYQGQEDVWVEIAWSSLGSDCMEVRYEEVSPGGCGCRNYEDT